MNSQDLERGKSLLNGHASIDAIRRYLSERPHSDRLALMFVQRSGKSAQTVQVRIDLETAQLLVPLIEQLYESEMKRLGIDWMSA